MKNTSSFSLRRRRLLIAGGAGVSSAVAGCGIPGGKYADIHITIDLKEVAERPDTEEGFELTVDVGIGLSDKPSIEDVVLVGYAEDGSRVARHPVGALGWEAPPEEVTTACSGFPEIITATTDTSACNETVIDIVYLKGPVTPADSRTWGETFRGCGDDLPPERPLENNG